MSRTRTIYDAHGPKAEYRDDELVWARDDFHADSTAGIQVIRDIEPYRSMADGSMITSRSQHREHLRRQNCIEIGNEKMESRPMAPTISRREVLSRQLGDMSDRQANQILKELKRG